jgi:hypothetical protein
MANIGPGQLKTPGAFVLNQPEWTAIQAYIYGALAVPTDQASLQASLPSGAPSGGFEQFNDLLAVYKTLHDHCSFWNEHTLPDSVSCASDIVHYNEKVPIYYGALTKLLPKLEMDPPDPDAVKLFNAIVTQLSNTAQGYSDHAANVKDAMTAFATQTRTDGGAVSCVHQKYVDKLGANGTTITALVAQINQSKSDLDAAEAEYRQDVIIAATSAAYAWIWPVGTIAAGIVAGIYGKKATDALAHVSGLKAGIEVEENELHSDQILIADLTRINSGLGDISQKIEAALPALELMRGLWGAIADDLKNILTVIAGNISQAPVIVKSLGIDEAIADWAKVAAEADGYRVNAYITVTTPDKAEEAGKELAATLGKTQTAPALSEMTAKAA